MIQNNNELTTIQERIAKFQRVLAQLRVSSTADEFHAISSGYRTEIERTQSDVLDYLTRHSSESALARVA